MGWDYRTRKRGELSCNYFQILVTCSHFVLSCLPPWRLFLAEIWRALFFWSARCVVLISRWSCETVVRIVIASTICPTVFVGNEASESGVFGSLFFSLQRALPQPPWLAFLLVRFLRLVISMFMSCIIFCKTHIISSWIASWVSAFAAGWRL